MSDLAEHAVRLSARLREAPAGGDGSHQGSAHRQLEEDLRREIVDVRSRLFELGIYDPLLVRFDTATVSQASNAEVADRLQQVAAALRSEPQAE